MPQAAMKDSTEWLDPAAKLDRAPSEARLKADVAQVLAAVGQATRRAETPTSRPLPFFDRHDLEHASPLDADTLPKIADPARPPALAPILPAESVLLLHGCRGVGLTHMIVGCAAALASGGSFLGWQADRPRRVLVLSGVDGLSGMAARIHAAFGALGAGPLPPDRLRLMSPDLHGGRNAPLDEMTGQGHLATLFGQAEAILIDDLSMHLHAARSASAPVDIGLLRRLLLVVRRTAKPIVIAQHSGGQMRSRADREALLAADGLADVVLGLRRPADWGPADGCRFELHVDRARHLAGAACRPREIRLMRREDGDTAWICDPVEESHKTRFLALLADGMPARLARAQVGVSRQAAWLWKKQAEAAACRSTENLPMHTAMPQLNSVSAFGIDSQNNDLCAGCSDLAASTRRQQTVNDASTTRQ